MSIERWKLYLWRGGCEQEKKPNPCLPWWEANRWCPRTENQKLIIISLCNLDPFQNTSITGSKVLEKVDSGKRNLGEYLRAQRECPNPLSLPAWPQWCPPEGTTNSCILKQRPERDVDRAWVCGKDAPCMWAGQLAVGVGREGGSHGPAWGSKGWLSWQCCLLA